MTQATIPRSGSEKFSKSVGGTMRSLVGGGGRTFFVLEYKNDTRKHRAGETARFIGDYIELGRGNDFAVGFGEECQTVSRPHAAIERTESGWHLKHLSKNNPTLVNGKPVPPAGWHLSHGDEIRLSVEGPKMIFLLPSGNTVGNLGMTARFNAFANEAIRPYRRALMGVSVGALALIGILAFFFTDKIEELNLKMENRAATSKRVSDSLATELAKKPRIVTQIIERFSALPDNKPQTEPLQSTNSAPSEVAKADIQNLYPSVFFIKTDKFVIVLPDGKTVEKKLGITGTAFALTGGRIVTARHVVQPWLFWKNEEDPFFTLNMAANLKDYQVIHYFTAYSPDGTKLHFKSTDFVADDKGDKTSTIADDQGNNYVLSRADERTDKDWSVATANKKGGLTPATDLSSNLKSGMELHTLGYPHGIGANNQNDIKPIYSKCMVARDGLDNGAIDVSNRNFDHGNSGGPVCALQNGQYVVVGIVSSSVGSTNGFIVPMSAVH